MVKLVIRVSGYIFALAGIKLLIHSSNREGYCRILQEIPLGSVIPISGLVMWRRASRADRAEYGINRMTVVFSGIEPMLIVRCAIRVPLRLELTFAPCNQSLFRMQ